ncbi:uncharacterized protein At4g02000-like [Arachis duranensis]|uniref:Uncharacterized protein At4g02000-like n=1 Tax=Arachis duranensis TaxID=130453 RepID=A0A6P4CFC3_ARADU|nr:uncharacterized protein At4g02000-like [Arachis duranensis]
MGNALKAIWGNSKGFSVSDKGDNSFQFFFNKEVDVLRVERGSPWLFKDYVLHVKRWKEDQNCDEEIIFNFSVWVQFWGLLESFKTLKVGRKLGEKLGTVLEVGKFQMQGRETRIVKAKINIDAARQVRDQLIVVGPNKKEVEVALRYERLGKFCTYCAKLRHNVKNYHDLLKDTESDMVKENDIGMSMQEGKQNLKPQDTGNRAAPESPQSATSRTECMEVIIAGQSNTKEDEGQLMQFVIG